MLSLRKAADEEWMRSIGAVEYQNSPKSMNKGRAVIGIETLVGLYLWFSTDIDGRPLFQLGADCWWHGYSRGDVIRLIDVLDVE